MNILRIDSSPMGVASQSRKATDQFMETLHASTLVHRDLCNPTLPHFDATWVGANFTPADSRSDEQLQALALSDQLVEEVRNSERIIISAPVYNFGVPARLKNWIDHVTRVGVTFRYGANGPEALLEDRPVHIIVSSGGTQIGSPLDFHSPYLRHILGFIGLRDVSFVSAAQLLETT